MNCHPLSRGHANAESASAQGTARLGWGPQGPRGYHAPNTAQRAPGRIAGHPAMIPLPTRTSMTPWLGVKLVHVLLGAFWFGGSVVGTFYLIAAARALGPAAAPVMKYVIGVRKLSVVLNIAAGLTLLTGLAMYDRLSDHFRHPVDDDERLGVIGARLGTRLGQGGRGHAEQQDQGKQVGSHGPSRWKPDHCSLGEAEDELSPSFARAR